MPVPNNKQKRISSPRQGTMPSTQKPTYSKVAKEVKDLEESFGIKTTDDTSTQDSTNTDMDNFIHSDTPNDTTETDSSTNKVPEKDEDILAELFYIFPEKTKLIEKLTAAGTLAKDIDTYFS
eukprot:8135106-Ditylum_brightwellii.AAC.1